MHINDLLKMASERKASDLHLKVGSHPVLRINGELIPLVETKRLMQEDTIAMAFSIMSNRQKQKFKDNLEIDIAYSVPGLGRFRCNVFQQRGTVGLVLRVIPVKIMTVRELGLPMVLEKICNEQRGLILCTGTTGSGKSTTLAAMIDFINSQRCEHIITIEDPIEFLHRDKKSIVNQREVEVDTRSFAAALRSALRQDPDVILVGEMRDYETIETAITAAETGHLVLSTLHTLDATETINRIISVFPPHQQKQIRLQLSGVLKAVISMRLVPARRRPRPRARGRGHDRHPVHPRLHHQQGQDEAHPRGDRRRACRSTGCRPSTSPSSSSTRRTSSATTRPCAAPATPTSSSSRSRGSRARRTWPRKRWKRRCSPSTWSRAQERPAGGGTSCRASRPLRPLPPAYGRALATLWPAATTPRRSCAGP